MEKARVIIADTDINYIIPLQLKFVKELWGQIRLEIITDRDYFKELFMKPQEAEILMVSEEMYDPSLRKHNVSLFLMTEQPGEGSAVQSDMVRIYKYVSVKEIFDKTAGRRIGAFHLAERLKKETQVITLASASGGVGKTTLAMGIGLYLAREGKRVLYVDAEHINTFGSRLGNQSAVTAPDVYRKLAQGEKRIYQDIKHVVRREIFDYMPPLKAALMSLGLDLSVYEKLVLSAKESADYDFILVDTSNAFDLYKAGLMDISDKVIIVLQQGKNAAYAAKTFAENVNGIHAEKYVFVCNKYEKGKYNALTSPELAGKFTVSQYIENFADSEEADMEKMSRVPAIGQLSLLL